jgi:uncharacterized oligopeptide transporter (OPT) family protein
MLRRFTLLISLLALAAPVAASAQDSPFAPLPPAQTQAPAPVTTQPGTTPADNGGLESWQTLLIVLGGGILLLGIAWAIVSDARSVAPTIENTEEREEARQRKEADLKRRKQKNRDAAKRSRAARKRNRP